MNKMELEAMNELFNEAPELFEPQIPTDEEMDAMFEDFKKNHPEEFL